MRSPSVPSLPVEEPPESPRRLGKFLAAGFALFFLMVGLGVGWVWLRFRREQAWKERINSSETFQAPPPTRPADAGKRP